MPYSPENISAAERVLRAAAALGLLALAALLLFRLFLSLRRRVRQRLSYTRSFSRSGTDAGGALTLTEEIVNPSFFPVFSFEIGFFVPAGLVVDGCEIPEKEQFSYVFSRFFLPPASRTVRTHTVLARRRGRYLLSTAEAPLDRYTVRYFDAPAELFVYPTPDRRVLLPRSELFTAGERLLLRRFLPDPFLASGLREYRYGDPVSRINFRASARSLREGRRQLIVNEYDSSAGCSVMLLVNFSTDGTGVSDADALARYIEGSLSVAAALLRETVRAGGRIGFAANACPDASPRPFLFHRPGGGKAQLLSVLRSLAEIARPTGYSFAALTERVLADLPPDAELILLSAKREDLSPGRLARLRRRVRNVTALSADRLFFAG